MKRIVLMLARNITRVPIWLYHIWRLGRPNDTHTEEERYHYLRNIVKRVNISGRVTVEGHGSENIPKENGFILFPNHQGLFDMLAIIDTCPNPFGVVVKKEASNIILVKQVIELLRGMSIDRKDIRASLTIINKMTEEVKEGRNYVIFAEGTRSKQENNILEFKGGTFKSAVNARCPIVPVALIDCYKPFDISSFNKVNVKVCYLPPIYPEQYIGLKTKEIADIVHNSIQNEINKNM
ncbi:1-acyl-sn-glycerol-3-phosphate acyltransferase [Clostridium sp. chh4-2]|uniref:lysophospholipid acyltransferase family protein n=1 Tax=Clostridium sp. chh4-2 TaxID=2067550 RepID=UPI000CCDCAAE|nr:lysophospholipid acyltransferase family protein [Clostridium sp. chh4-2]PNV61620.1 1-acyl-sn-glycerol-3-phosphate acyltransferase [Clostridium sp. chh4-2]